MPRTVRDALKDEPLCRSEVIAGKEGLNRELSSFGIPDAPDAFQFVETGEFVMTTGYIFKDDFVLQEKIVKELCEKGAAGLGIKFNRYIKNFSEQTIQYANEHQFPLIALPINQSWYKLTMPIIMDSLYDDKNTNIHDFMDIYLERLLNLSDTYEILKLLNEITGLPCYLFADTNQRMCCPPEAKAIPGIEGLLEQSQNNGGMVIKSRVERVALLGGMGGTAVVIKMVQDVSDLLNIVIWECGSRITNKQMEIIDFICCTLRQSKFITILEPKEEFIDHLSKFIFELLHGAGMDFESGKNNANRLGITFTTENIVSVANRSQSGNAHFLQYYDERYHKKMMKVLFDIGKNLNVPCSMGKFDELIFLLPVTQRDTVEAIHKVVGEIQSILQEQFVDTKFSFGIGDYHKGIEGMRPSYREALTALHIGGEIGGSGSITTFGELGVYRLLCNHAVANDARKFCDDYLLPVIDYDKEYNSELMMTLNVYMECGQNLRKTAEKIFIHHNTVRYRLNLIEKLLKLSFGKADDILAVEIALKIKTLLDAKLI